MLDPMSFSVDWNSTFGKMDYWDTTDDGRLHFFKHEYILFKIFESENLALKGSTWGYSRYYPVGYQD